MRKWISTLGMVCLIVVVAACREQPTPTPTKTQIPTATVARTRTFTPVPTETTTPTTPPTEAATSSPPPTTTLSPRPVPTTSAPSPVPPTRTPSPLSPTPRPPAVIHTFHARAADGTELTTADPGETIVLEWSWSGGTAGTIYRMVGYQLGDASWKVEPSGSLAVTIPPGLRNTVDYVLFVDGSSAPAARAMVEIELTCAEDWFFAPPPDGCPADAPLITDAAEQHFHRGTMVWNRAEDRIYVLFGDGGGPAWRAYQDAFDEGEDLVSDPGIQPPPGSYQPIRGFGLVWREQPGVRNRLGWAMDTETGYQTAIQRSSYVRYNAIYIRALDGGVWRLGPEHREWEYLSVSGATEGGWAYADDCELARR